MPVFKCFCMCMSPCVGVNKFECVGLPAAFSNIENVFSAEIRIMQPSFSPGTNALNGIFIFVSFQVATPTVYTALCEVSLLDDAEKSEEVAYVYRRSRIKYGV